MEYDIKFGWENFQKAVEHLVQEESRKEEAMFFLSETIEQANQINFIIKVALPVPQDALLSQSFKHVLINPKFTIYIIKCCQRLNFSLILAHIHLCQRVQPLWFP